MVPTRRRTAGPSSPVTAPLGGDVHDAYLTARRSRDPSERLLAQMLETLTTLLPASAALAFAVGDEWTVEWTMGAVATAEDVTAVADLARRLPPLEPINPFSARRAERRGAVVMSAADAGGERRLEASMFGRHLRRHGHHSAVALHFRREGRIASGVMLLRRLELPPFDAQAVRLLGRLHAFLEHALTTGDPPASPGALAAARLTPRESEIAGLVAEARSNAAIAAELGMREATVKTHLTRVYRKLGLRSRTELAILLREAREPTLPHARRFVRAGEPALRPIAMDDRG